jgi:hypothetical protein
METKQTATDWLFHKLWDTPKDKLNWYAILKKAEEMHEKQIIKANMVGMSIGFDDNPEYIATKYYNITYGKTEPKR